VTGRIERGIHLVSEEPRSLVSAAPSKPPAGVECFHGTALDQGPGDNISILLRGASAGSTALWVL
jgi:translation elongation factor EF-Tu-like GTPase